MSKTYSYYGLCFNDLRVGASGGLSIDGGRIDRREPIATDADPRALWEKVVGVRRNDSPDICVTGHGVTYNDPVNDCTYVLWGNHYFEDIGVFRPMLPADYDRGEIIRGNVVPKHVSCMD